MRITNFWSWKRNNSRSRKKLFRTRRSLHRQAACRWILTQKILSTRDKGGRTNKSHARKPIYLMVPKRSRHSKKWTYFSSPGVNIKAKQNSGTRKKTTCIQNQKVLTQTSRLPIKIDLENTIKKIEEAERRKQNLENLCDGTEALEMQNEIPRFLISWWKYYNRTRLNKRLLCRLYFHTLTRVDVSSKCALNHLQNAVDCLCSKEIQRCVDSLAALLSRAKPRTWHNNRMWKQCTRDSVLFA